MDPQRMRILICDTDPEVLIQAERMLEDAGFDMTQPPKTGPSRM
jgi:DNA-binding response OmpR family regulator